jgi:hypothetical protein
VSKAAPIARWLLGLIVAYILFIAFRLQYQFTSAMR